MTEEELIPLGRKPFDFVILSRQVVYDDQAISPSLRIYLTTGTTDRPSLDSFCLKRKVRTIKNATSGMAIA